MSTTIDERVVEMRFDNRQFENNVQTSMSTLDKLKQKLNFNGASKGLENRVRLILDIEGYKAKREKTLEDLAEKIARTVVKTRRDVTLEPMQAYERKIIHSKLQNNSKVTTKSVGEEPRRRVVITLIK